MKIIKTTLLGLFLLLFFQASAQKKDIAHQYKHELGINITDMLVRSLGNQAGFEASDFPVSYKRRLGNNKYLRIGAGMNITRADNTLSLNENLLKGDLRLGFEWRRVLTNSFLLTYGFNGRAGYSEEIISNENVELYTRDAKAGGDIFLGLQWLIAKNIALEIESSLYALVGNRQEETRFITFPGPEDINQQSRLEAKINTPQWLYFIVKF